MWATIQKFRMNSSFKWDLLGFPGARGAGRGNITGISGVLSTLLRCGLRTSHCGALRSTAEHCGTPAWERFDGASVVQVMVARLIRCTFKGEKQRHYGTGSDNEDARVSA